MSQDGEQLPLIDDANDENASDGTDPGWVRLYRRMMGGPAWASPDLWKVYSWCLMRASYSNRWVTLSTGRGSTVIELQPGQFIFGRNAAAGELQMPAETARTRIEKLAKLELISIASTRHCTIVTVSNYSTSDNGRIDLHRASTNQPPTNHQASTTYKKVNKGKKGENDSCDAAAERPTSPPEITSFTYPVFPCITGKKSGDRCWELHEDVIGELSAAFPAVDVRAQCLIAHAWTIVNPSKRKTAKGMAKFLFGWMERQQNDGRGSRFLSSSPSNGHSLRIVQPAPIPAEPPARVQKAGAI